MKPILFHVYCCCIFVGFLFPGFDYPQVSILTSTNLITVPPTEKIIPDIKKYFGCFSANECSSYEVTLYVKQPIPNSRAVLSDAHENTFPASLDLDSITAGHTFLGFSQSGGPAPTTTRIVGFYPSSDVTPLLPIAAGVLVDNSNTDYDISVTFKVTSSNFQAILNSFNSFASADYNLNWNNCSSICIDALKAAGISVPKTIRQWPLGRGANPADLGEDLRSYQAINIKSKNTNGGSSSSNTQPCK